MWGIRRNLLAVALCLAPALLIASWLATAAAADASTLYVAADGNDEAGANGCLEQASPCATVENAVAKASGGDTISIGPGEYHEAIEANVELHLVGGGSSGAEQTLLVSSGESVPGVWMKAGGSLEHLALSDDFPGIGGDLRSEGGDVTAKDISVRTAPPQNGTDAIGIGGGSFTLSDSTVEAVNSDEVIENSVVSRPSEETPVINDGSGIEISAGTLTVASSQVSAQRGMALRVHGSTSSVSVRDSVVSVGGEEDLSGAGSGGDGWPAIEAGSGLIELVGDTVFNATQGSPEESRPPADALMVERAGGISVALKNTIVRAQPGGYGSDIDTWEPVGATHSSFTSTTLNGAAASITPQDTAGNLSGDPQLADPAHGDLSLTAASPLTGAGDPEVVNGGETDVSGAPRSLSCTAGVTVLNIGAYETAAPQCPAAPPTLEPGVHSYLYIQHGVGDEGQGYEQLLLGEEGLLDKLEPFEAKPVHATSGTIIAGTDARQLYAFEEGVLQQYKITGTGQLVPGTAIEAPHGASFGGAALSADGHDLYILLSSGTGPEKQIALAHERVGDEGSVSQAAAPTLLPSGIAGARVALDQAGHVYVLANHEAAGSEEPTASLYDYRANPDGTLTAEDSIALEHTGAALTIAPDGSEAVVTRYSFNSLGSGQLYPFKVAADGAFTAAPAVSSGAQNPARTSDNNPTGARFTPDSRTLFVANEDEVQGFESVVTVGSIASPFAVESDGSLRPQTPTPNPEAGGLPNEYEFEAGLAISPDGKSLYAPNNHEEPAAGSIDQFTIEAEGALASKSPASLGGDAYQGSLAVVSPPGSGGEEHKEEGGGGGSVVLGPPPPAPVVSQGIAGQVVGGPTHASVAGAQVSACPRGHLASGGCVDSATDSSGHYVLHTKPGVWLVQVEPPGSSLFPASVEVSVAPGAQTTQNFALAAPRPIPKGVVFQTPGGPVSSGIPTVNWATPFSFAAPAGAPKHERPGATLLVGHLLGLTSNTSSSQGKAFNVSGVLMYGVHYNANGKPTGMTNPLVGEVSCDANCSRLMAAAHPANGSSGIVLAHGPGNSTLVVVQGSEGHQVVLTVSYYYSPGLAGGNDPLANVSVNLGPNPPNGKSNLEQAIDAEENELEKNPGEHHEGATHIDDGEDLANVDVASLNESTHGGGGWYDDEMRGRDGPQPPVDGEHEVSVYSPEDTRLGEDEIQADEQDVIVSINEYLTAHGEPPLDPEEEAIFTSSFDDYVAEVGALGDLAHPSEEDNEPGFFDYLERAEGEISRLNLSDEAAQLLYESLRDGAPRLFPKATKELEEDEAAATEESRQIAAEERQREQERGEPESEPTEPPPEYEPDEDNEGDIFFDPSGLVRSTLRVPLAGATVTLTRSTKPHGRQRRVPSGSDIMSPANRRNPGRSTVAGLFGWDTIPGYYQVSATHRGCRPAHTGVLAVPPPRAHLLLSLRCKAFQRRPTRLAVQAHKGRVGTLVVKVAVKPARGHARSRQLLGTITIARGHRRLTAVALDGHGRALIDLPGSSKVRRLKITYSGNGLFAPARRYG